MRAVLGAAGTVLSILLGIFLVVWVIKWTSKRPAWSRLARYFRRSRRDSSVEFYERLLAALRIKGFIREASQTPLEFAFAVGDPDAVRITQQYQQVRFGERSLSRDEAKEIDHLLRNLEGKQKGGR